LSSLRTSRGLPVTKSVWCEAGNWVGREMGTAPCLIRGRAILVNDEKRNGCNDKTIGAPSTPGILLRYYLSYPIPLYDKADSTSQIRYFI
jgi:hypothetical protein